MKAKMLFTLYGATLLFQVHGQANISNKGLLKIGDRVPDVKFEHVINFSSEKARVSDFHDKLLILDFWSTWCEPCVRAFPKLDSLQRKFKGEIQIMPVTWQDASSIEHFFNRIKKQRDYVLPTAVDTVLYKHFVDSTNRWSGQYAWIKEGKIVALTSGESVTAENIRTVLSGESLTIEYQRKFGQLLPNDFSRPLLLVNEHSGRANKVMNYSALMPYIEGLEPRPYSKLPTPDDETAGIRLVNLSLPFLYLYAYQISSFTTDVLIEVKDQSKFQQENGDSTQLYCYELIMPKAEGETLREVMKDDLKKVFGYNVTKEKRNVNCAILKKRGKDGLLSTRGGVPFGESSNFYITLRNQPFSKLVSSLDYYLPRHSFRFVIDETGISANIDINIEAYLRDTGAVARELKKYGLDLVIDKRYMDIWVMRDGETE